MCKFFSFITNGKGRLYYFDSEIRPKIIKGELQYDTDSHTSIADYFQQNEDKSNKYEYNPLLYKLQIDQINTTDDSKRAEALVKKLDFMTIVPELIIKPIVNPFKISPPKIGENHKELLRNWDLVWALVWASVGDPVRDSVVDSVRASVGASVGALVWASVWDSVRNSVVDSVGASVRASVGASVWDSVWDSVGDSVGASVGAYIGSFFNLPDSAWKYINSTKTEGYPFKRAVELWEMGLVPSFDGTVWRLHGGEKAKILYKWKKNKAREN